MAVNDLTTLVNVKMWLPIPTSQTSEDLTLARLITATSEDFMRATKRPDLLTASYSEVREGDGSARMILRHWPITAVTTLSVAGVAIAASANKIAPGWYFDADLDPELLWELYLAGYTFADGATIQIGYTAGYVTVPGDIEQAVIDWVAYRYKGRPTVGIAQTKFGGREGDEVKTEQVDIPLSTQSVIEKYRREIPTLDRRKEKMAQQPRVWAKPAPGNGGGGAA